MHYGCAFANGVTRCTFVIGVTGCTLAIRVTRWTFAIGVKNIDFCIHLVTQSSWFAMTSTGGIVVLLLIHELCSWIFAFASRRVSLAWKFFLLGSRSKFFWTRFIKFPDFFFFCRFCFYFFIFVLPPFTPRTFGDYLLRPHRRYKKSKDMPWKVRKWSR